MSTLQEDMEQLNRAVGDLAYAVCKAVGIVWLAEKFGMKLRPWAREARIRDNMRP